MVACRLVMAGLVMLVMGWPVLAQNGPLGVNLAFLKDYSQTLTFVDIFRASRPWISHRPSDRRWDSGLAFDLDEKGWVRSLKPDQEAGTLMMLEIGNAYPAGQYVCLYEGEGELYFEWDARVVSQQPGRIVVDVQPKDGIHMVIRKTNPGNYVRNIRVVMPGFESTFEQHPFHPAYVDFLRQFKVLRFKDWALVDNRAPGVWAERATPDDATQAGDKGVALEYMVRMANEAGANAWFSVPHDATNEYVTNMARLIRDQLRPDLRVYVEYSNEVWNGIYPQHAYVRNQGMALGLHASDSFIAGLRFHAQRSVEIFDIFEREFGSVDRLVRVMGGWQPGVFGFAGWLLETILDWRNAAEKTDVYAVAPYFGHFLGTPEFADQLAGMSVGAVLDSAQAEMRRMLVIGRQLKDLAAARGVDLIAYEGGQHLAGVGPQQDNTNAVAIFAAANRHPRMYDLYTEYLAGWYGFSGLMTLFNDIQWFTRFGSWGLLERWDQAIETAPKYRAVRHFLQPQPIPGPASPVPSAPVPTEPVPSVPVPSVPVPSVPVPSVPVPSVPVPFIALSAEGLNFGNVVRVGSTGELTLEVSNRGQADLVITGIQVSDSAFAVLPSNFQVPSGQTVSVVVRFRPRVPGDYQAVLIVVSDDPQRPSLRVPVRATAPERPLPVVQVLTGAVDFGSVRLTETGQSVVVIHNAGMADLIVEKLRVSGSAFAVSDTAITVGPGDRVTVAVTFAPIDTLVYTDSLQVLSNDPAQGVIAVALLGRGLSRMGDFDGNGSVGFEDFILFARAFGGSDPKFDLNGDGIVGLPDFVIFGKAYGPS